MARSNKPMLWFPFAAGGLVAALITPAVILVGLLASCGVLNLSHEKIAVFAHNPLGKLVLLGIVAAPAWHAAHRLRMTAHDLGLGGGIVVKAICYGTAWVAIIAAVGALLLV